MFAYNAPLCYFNCCFYRQLFFMSNLVSCFYFFFLFFCCDAAALGWFYAAFLLEGESNFYFMALADGGAMGIGVHQL